MDNLLIRPLIHAAPGGMLTLPGILAALARDEVDSFPALRPHQAPAWHMFLVQLAALALVRNGTSEIPQNETDWAAALRALTVDFDADEPWCLTIDDQSKPAFLQPPVPAGAVLPKAVTSPDALDLLITAKNHDVKRSVAREGFEEDWVFALVSLQTGEGYGGRDNHGIARMNGGSSSRAMLTLAPLRSDRVKTMTPRFGARFRRDVTVLLETRHVELMAHEHLDYPETGGLGLTWIAPWPEGRQLQVKDLDIWFIEVCRRVRLQRAGGNTLIGRKGTSKATRINAKHLKGALGDPFAPVHKTDHKSLTLSGRDFDYRLLTDILLSGNWVLPVLARPRPGERGGETMAVVVEALARGNSKTEGFKSRVLPLGGEALRVLGAQRERLHELARQQIDEIGVFEKALGSGLALVAAAGDRERVEKKHYAHANEARSRFDRVVDARFFHHLWNRFKVQDRGVEPLTASRVRFATELLAVARENFEASLPAVPCAGFFRARAETRGRGAFLGKIRDSFPELFELRDREGSAHGA